MLRQRRERRRVFTHLFRVLEEILIHIELASAWRDAGGIDTVLGLLEVDESWRSRIPPSPPSLPVDFEDVASKISEWEAGRGSHLLTKQLASIRDTVSLVNQLHTGLEVYAKDPASEIPNRSMSAFTDMQEGLKGKAKQLLKDSARYRLPLWRRTLKSLGSQLKSILNAT